MNKLQKILFIGFLIAIIGMVYLEATKKNPINWFPSYHKKDKIPYGTYILHHLLETSFSEKLINSNKPPYEFLQDSTKSGTYLFVNDNINFDETEIEKLLEWTNQGNTVFISANYLSSKFLDTLQLEMKTAFLQNSIKTEPLLNLVHPTLASKKPFHIQKNVPIQYFSKLDTLHNTILGICQAYNDTLKINKPLVNFINISIGSGNLFLHTQPEVFTNFFLLEADKNIEYSQAILSYINTKNTIFWDTHYKTGKPIQLSPLYILLNNKYLKWSYYMVLIGAALFVLFEGKRKQRNIPIIKPLTNKTYQYTQTIARMYLDKKKHHEISLKQIDLFFEYIRSVLRIPTNIINSRFLQSVAARSGNSIENTKELFQLIEKIQKQKHTNQDQLIQLNTKISQFKNT